MYLDVMNAHKVDEKKYLPKVSIIIVNFNGRSLIENCLNSLFSSNYPLNKLEIIVVDNGSTDNSVSFVRRNFPRVKIIKSKENNYAKANNIGIKHSKGKYIVFLNNDTQVDKNWLLPLVELAKSDKRIGAVGSKLLLPDGRLQSFGHREYPNYVWGDNGHGDNPDLPQYNKITEVKSICGAAVLYKRECFKKVGFFDEDFNMFLEDVDMGYRCGKKGWRLLVCPQSIVYHNFHGTINKEGNVSYWIKRNRILFIAKHLPESLPNAITSRVNLILELNLRLKKDSASFVNILGDAVLKLIKEHGIKKFLAIAPTLFSSAAKLYYIERKYFISIISFLEQYKRQKRDSVVF